MGERFRKEGNLCMPVADSSLCMTETGRILSSSYPPIFFLNFSTDKIQTPIMGNVRGRIRQ